MPTHYHIAQINIARMLAPINDPLLDDFVAQLDAINSLADESPGFVWRLQSDSGNDTDIAAYEDALILINMSVWESIESLQAYAYRSEHVGVFRQRRQWFKKPDGPHLALWWVPAGKLPTVEEGQSKLDILAQYGPSPKAFTFKARFPAPDGQDLPI
jgi:hypothetical protein